MERRRAITIFWLGSAVISPAANAYWLFPDSATPVVYVSYSHHRHHRYRHHYRHRRAAGHARTILVYRRYDASVPMSRTRAPYRSRPRVHLPQARHRSSSGRRWHPPRQTVAGSSPHPVAANGVSQGHAAPIHAGQGAAALPNTPPGRAAGSGIPAPANVAAAPVKPDSPMKPSVPSQPSLEEIQDDQLYPPEMQAPAVPRQASFAPATSSTVLNSGPLRHPRTFSRLPIMGGLLALAGLGYARVRRRKRQQMDDAASRARPSVPAAEERSAQTPVHAKAVRPSAWPGFNFDEVRRLDVDRVILAPFPGVPGGIGNAASVRTANAGRQTERSEQAADGTEPPSMIQHTYGETTLGTVTEQYDTPEAKAGLEDFYTHIPVQFQEPVWVKVQYNGGQRYTFAMAAPDVDVHLGDEVQIVFGQQDPPVPNQVVAIVRSTYSSTANNRPSPAE